MDASARKIFEWYEKNKRDLPWRRTTDAYRIFISELMLQQTQVDRVVVLYTTFIKTFPTWKKLSEAKTDKLIHGWAGLGYNRRALFAREAARNVVSNGIGTDEVSWRKLKGVGPYMASSLTAFVNHKPALVIDTNIRRVIGRIYAKLSYPKPSDDQRIKKILGRIQPSTIDPAIFPQALMDLGSAICTARQPRCEICPVRDTCLSSKSFQSKNPPIPPKRQITERIHSEKKYPDRIYRGRILACLREKTTILINEYLGTFIDPTFDPIADADWLRAMCERMMKDGLVEMRNGKLRLPK